MTIRINCRVRINWTQILQIIGGIILIALSIIIVPINENDATHCLIMIPAGLVAILAAKPVTIRKYRRRVAR